MDETDDFKKQLEKNRTSDYEGIWETSPYIIGIKKKGDKYIGFIIESGVATWTKGQVKLTISKTENETKSVYYMRDHSAVESGNVTMIGKNVLQIGNVTLSR